MIVPIATGIHRPISRSRRMNEVLIAGASPRNVSIGIIPPSTIPTPPGRIGIVEMSLIRVQMVRMSVMFGETPSAKRIRPILANSRTRPAKEIEIESRAIFLSVRIFSRLCRKDFEKF